MTDISSATIAELGQALRAGRVKARDLLEQALQNRKEALGAYKLWMPDQAGRAADLADAAFAEGLDFGPLQGLPVSVKDLFGLAGTPTHAGAPKPLPASWEAEGPVVAAVRNGLAVITGKTHTVEFAFGGVGSNPHWGTPRNPWGGESHRVPGGSSAGAGVSLLEGTAVVALGSDTAGSVRVPASFTGTVGLKTSYGRWSLQGIVPLSPSLDTAGVLTRSVADAALAFAAIDPVCRTPPEPADPARLTLGVVESFFEDCGPGVAETVRTALAELEERGVTVQPFDLPEMAVAREVFGRGGLAVPEFVAFVENELPEFKATLDPNVRSRFEAFEPITATDYLGRRMQLARAAAAANARLADIDALVGPTTPITAPLLQHACRGRRLPHAQHGGAPQHHAGQYAGALRAHGPGRPRRRRHAGRPAASRRARHGRAADFHRSCRRERYRPGLPPPGDPSGPLNPAPCERKRDPWPMSPSTSPARRR